MILSKFWGAFAPVMKQVMISSTLRNQYNNYIIRKKTKTFLQTKCTWGMAVKVAVIVLPTCFTLLCRPMPQVNRLWRVNPHTNCRYDCYSCRSSDWNCKQESSFLIFSMSKITFGHPEPLILSWRTERKIMTSDNEVMEEKVIEV